MEKGNLRKSKVSVCNIPIVALIYAINSQDLQIQTN